MPGATGDTGLPYQINSLPHATFQRKGKSDQRPGLDALPSSLIPYPPATMDASPIQYARTEDGANIVYWTNVPAFGLT